LTLLLRGAKFSDESWSEADRDRRGHGEPWGPPRRPNAASRGKPTTFICPRMPTNSSLFPCNSRRTIHPLRLSSRAASLYPARLPSLLSENTADAGCRNPSWRGTHGTTIHRSGSGLLGSLYAGFFGGRSELSMGPSRELRDILQFI